MLLTRGGPQNSARSFMRGIIDPLGARLSLSHFLCTPSPTLQTRDSLADAPMPRFNRVNVSALLI